MSIPKEPRQQMINIMYLVLIALLALSVSSEILNAFKIVNDGITSSNDAFKGQTEATLTGMEAKIAEDQSAKNQSYLDAAKKTSAVTAEFLATIDDIENELKAESSLDENGEFAKPEDQDVPSRVMLGATENGRAYELKQKIIETRQKYMDLFKPFDGGKKDIEYMTGAIPLREPAVPEGETKDWENYNFYQMPALATTTLLNQFRNYAHATEQMVVQRFSEKIGGVDPVLDFSKMRAVVVPKSRTVEQGDMYEADVFVSATSSESLPTINIGGQTLTVNAQGIAKYSARATNLGGQSVSGSASIKGPDGKMQNMKIRENFMVVPKAEQAKDYPDVRPQLAEAEREIERLKEEMKKMEYKDPNKKVVDFEDLRIPFKEAQERIAFLEANWEPKKDTKTEMVAKDLLDRANLKIKELETEIERLKKEMEKMVYKKDVPTPEPEKPDPPKPKPNEPMVKIVKEPAGTVSADKMNVFYIGVPNPITTIISGANPGDVDAQGGGCILKKYGPGKYNAWVKGPKGGEATVKMNVAGKHIATRNFRIKRIPDPVPTVGSKAGGIMGTGEMRAQLGLKAKLADFPFDAKFEVLGFEMILAERGQDLVVSRNPGARFNEKSKQLLNRAKVGNIYFFNEIKVKGPDKLTRTLPSISFQIK